MPDVPTSQTIKSWDIGGRDRRRSGDPALFRRMLCLLSYPTEKSARTFSAVPTGLEPATSGLTGRRELQLHHGTKMSEPHFLRLWCFDLSC